MEETGKYLQDMLALSALLAEDYDLDQDEKDIMAEVNGMVGRVAERHPED